MTYHQTIGEFEQTNFLVVNWPVLIIMMIESAAHKMRPYQEEDILLRFILIYYRMKMPLQHNEAIRYLDDFFLPRARIFSTSTAIENAIAK